MQKVYGYTRVSTAKQGIQGVSLDEQRSAIETFAKRNNLRVVKWYEERETAAKGGRPVFTEMIAKLRKGVVSGVIIHKIDRSARNLRDWADLGELIDSGVQIYFANEGIDLSTRGGRLSADLQAVIAADFIRNLREETIKGMYGRLKQGIYPFKAPIGYLDTGKGQPKALDPKLAPLIRALFEHYATERYTLDQLRHKAASEGLVGKDGAPLPINRLSKILNNPFYYGVMRINKTGETFQGIHEPLIPVSLYQCCQDILHGRTVARPFKHDFLFRRLLKCSNCGYSLIGERQKGYTYYRCHTKECSIKTVREEFVAKHVQHFLLTLSILDRAKGPLLRLAEDEVTYHNTQSAIAKARLTKQLTDVETRLGRLADALIDGDIDRATYLSRKQAYFDNKASIEEELKRISTDRAERLRRFEDFLERNSGLYPRYIRSGTVTKRMILKTTTLNRAVQSEYVHIEPRGPFACVRESVSAYASAHSSGLPRTFDENTACVREEELDEEVIEKLFKSLWNNHSNE